MVEQQFDYRDRLSLDEYMVLFRRYETHPSGDYESWYLAEWCKGGLGVSYRAVVNNPHSYWLGLIEGEDRNRRIRLLQEALDVIG